MQMIARILLPMCLLGLIAACDKPASQGQSAPAVAVVDLNKVFTDSKAAKEGMKLLEGVKDQYEPQLKKMQEEMTKAAPEAGKGQDKPGQPKDDESSAAFGELIGQYQTALNEERTRLSAILDESLGKALESVRAKRGLKAVLPKEGVASFDPAIDITEEVLKELDAMNVAFTPAPKAPAAPVAPAPAAPAAPEQPKP